MHRKWQTFEKSRLVLFVSDVAFDVWGNCFAFFDTIRKGEQKEKINDVEAPPILMASTELGHNYFILYYAWNREGQKLQEDLKMQEYGIFEELM